MKKILLISAAILLVAAGCSKKQPENSTIKDSNVSEVSHGSNSPIQSHRTYSINMLSTLDNIKPGQSVNIKFNIKDERGNILKDFEVAHEKIVHFLIVRKDLQDFQHVHPDFNKSTGEFSIDVTFPNDGPYRMFADFTPQGTQMGPDGMHLGVTVYQDVVSGDLNKYKVATTTVDSDILKVVDGYRINYNFPEVLKSNTEVSYSLIIEKNNEDIALQNYLGALGHSVVLKKDTLDFMHVHAEGKNGPGMDMSGSSGQMDHKMPGAFINFKTIFPEAGVYKMFTQFQAKGKIITSDYTIQVSN
jgi:hypothetical protein